MVYIGQISGKYVDSAHVHSNIQHRHLLVISQPLPMEKGKGSFKLRNEQRAMIERLFHLYLRSPGNLMQNDLQE